MVTVVSSSWLVTTVGISTSLTILTFCQISRMSHEVYKLWKRCLVHYFFKIICCLLKIYATICRPRAFIWLLIYILNPGWKKDKTFIYHSKVNKSIFRVFCDCIFFIYLVSIEVSKYSLYRQKIPVLEKDSLDEIQPQRHSVGFPRLLHICVYFYL